MLFKGRLIRQTGNGTGLSGVDWGQVGKESLVGAGTGLITFGASSALNNSGMANSLLDKMNVTNETTRNIMRSTINGFAGGTVGGFGSGVLNGVINGEWNVWESTWKGAAWGTAGGLAYGALTDAYGKYVNNGKNASRTTAEAGKNIVEAGKDMSLSGIETGGGGIEIVHFQKTNQTFVYIDAPAFTYGNAIAPVPPRPYFDYQTTIGDVMRRLFKTK